MTQTTALSTEQRRQSIYASLLRYSPEAGELRERALDRLVMGALLGGSMSCPYRMGAIVTNLRFGSASTELRTEVIQDTLTRLVSLNMVAVTELRKRHAYYLSPAGVKEIGVATASAEQLFRSVVDRMLLNTAHLVPGTIATRLVRRFISECLARFGRRIAKVVLGQAQHDEVVPDADARLAFEAAHKDVALSDEARESLQERCLAFLRSKHHDDEHLKFSLTQGFYFTQLIGVDSLSFNPLAQNAFEDAVFYVDSNILIPRMLSANDASHYDELILQSKRIGIQLVVTRATINEIRIVAADRERKLERLLRKLPDDVAELSDDQFLSGYLDAREKQPDLSVRKFMEPFDHVLELVQQLGIELDDRVEDEILGESTFEHVAAIMQGDSVDVRKFKKADEVLRHDVALYALIMAEREDTPKTWFLTRDRSWLRAGARLAGGNLPFCFSLLGFLHSISPFVTAADDENPLVEVFSAFLSEQVFPSDSLFELQELLLLAEMHEDVLATPHEHLIRALDYVKRNVLLGEQYTKENAGRFSLGLKTFLASSAEEKTQALVGDRDRLAREAELSAGALEAERCRREAAEGRASQLGEEVDHLNGKLSTIEAVALDRANEIETIRARLTADRSRLARNGMIQGIVAGVSCWLFVDQIASLLATRFPTLSSLRGMVELLIAGGGTALFVLPAVRFIERVEWGNEVKIAFLGLIITVGAAFSRLFDNQTWSTWSAYIQAGVFAAALIVYFVRRP